MAKLKAGILSLGASGRLGPDIVLTKHGHTTIARRYKPPTDTKTDEQLTRRAWFSQCVAAWHQLTPAQKEEYRLIDPRVGTNAAYLNFMKEWLHMAVPLHKATHEKDGTDELDVKDLASEEVGESDAPLLNIVLLVPPVEVLDTGNTGSIAATWLQIDGTVGSAAIAVILQAWFRDSGSAGVQTYFSVDRDQFGTEILIEGNHINNAIVIAHGLIPLFPDQWIRYVLTASGAGAARGRIRVVGYLEPVEV